MQNADLLLTDNRWPQARETSMAGHEVFSFNLKYLYSTIYFLGLDVLRLAADDKDDPSEGGNAQVVYSVEKNVLDEQTGTPIFSVDPHSGLIRTTICCLDREKTAEYSLRVVATDGGGLKGKN